LLPNQWYQRMLRSKMTGRGGKLVRKEGGEGGRTFTKRIGHNDKIEKS